MPNQATLIPVEVSSIAKRIKAWHCKKVQIVINMETGELLEYHKFLSHPRFKEAWSMSVANEFGCLAQGVGGCVKGTTTIEFISKSEVSSDRLNDVTYIKFLCSVQTEKKNSSSLAPPWEAT